MTLTAVLFVGGLSTRMGRDKALLEISGEPLWLRQLNLLRGLKPAALWISAREKPPWCPPGIETIPDVPPSRGPLGGLAETLGRVKTSHLLALAIDLPQMTIEPLNALWQQVEPEIGVVPESPRGSEPLCAIYPREAAPAARAALDSGELSLQPFVAKLRRENLVRTYPLAPAEQTFFLNVNSPDDLESLHRRASF
ncbi:MAG TPA: molybdenum cofactor guanylyltransferase [Candidatus Paceibacterota bacterium]|nr:molybdenum cofactor guanylyltransferase [Candidatus Paceibacterota bacterium]